MRPQRPPLEPTLPEFELTQRRIVARHPIGPPCERRRVPIELMQRGERVDEVTCDSIPARALERGAFLRAPRQRRPTFDSLAEEKRRAQDRSIIASEKSPGNWNGAALQGAQRLEFGHRAVGREQAVGRPDAKDDVLRLRKACQAHAISNPGKPGGKFHQTFDGDGGACLGAEIVGESSAQNNRVLESPRGRRPSFARGPSSRPLSLCLFHYAAAALEGL